ncbi:hypothetical protein GCM10010492_19740 [Saccharothrix mutabilis subsp. mutabilis]|uniref:Uncharacterized protein n=1 Tax=Saccharothrix mutabilis subsp. mutabilis TaxID=66855 RepID=A0ABN0THB6_9PSEU
MADGRRIGGAGGGSDPANKSNAGAVLLAGVVAVGALGGGAGVSTIGELTGGATGGQSVSVRKAEGRKDAKRGDADAAWRRFSMREKRRSTLQRAECVASSFGQVQEYFLRHRCTSMDSILIAVEDDSGGTALISVVWVGFATARDAGGFKRLMDKHATGDVTPLPASLLGLPATTFHGHNYGSDQDRTVVTVAEAEAATGHLPAEVLDALAETAAALPKP